MSDGAQAEHVYAHPRREAEARAWMIEQGCPLAELHLDPKCPPDTVYATVEPLEDLGDG